MRIDGHRADLVILKTARAQAAFEGRKHITSTDILLATELAIPHRLKRGPFTDGQMSMGALQSQLEQIEAEYGEGDEDAQPGESGEGEMDDKKKVLR